MCSYKVNSMWEQWSRLNSIHQGISNMVTTYLSETHCYYVNAISKGNNIVFLYTGIDPSVELEKHLKLKPSPFMHLNFHTKLRTIILKCFVLKHSVFKTKRLRSVVWSLVWKFNCIFTSCLDVFEMMRNLSLSLMIYSAFFLHHGCKGRALLQCYCPQIMNSDINSGV